MTSPPSSSRPNSRTASNPAALSQERLSCATQVRSSEARRPESQPRNRPQGTKWQFRQAVRHLRALAHQERPLRCAERRDVGHGEMTRASVAYEQQRLVDV
eukprot:scaffold77567_cov61-Phaeocystis_antarctica.AAC.1